MARPPIVAPWTAEQDEKLKALIAEGVSATRASAVLNRRISGVRARARKLGVAFPTVSQDRKKWADPDRNKNYITPYAR
jgi:hypothetical protein